MLASVSSRWESRDGDANYNSLTHDPVTVPVAHVRLGRMTTADGRDAMGPRLRTGDASFPVVVIHPESVAGLSTLLDGNVRRRW